MLAGALLSLFGLLLQYVKASFVATAAKAASSGHEFFLSTFLFAAGLFMLALKIDIKKEGVAAETSRKHSLLIYLYHPILVVVVFL